MISAIKVINIFLLEDREQPFCKLCYSVQFLMKMEMKGIHNTSEQSR